MFKRRRKETGRLRPRPDLPNAESASAFISELAHEIRNPLNSISANLQLLEEDLQPESKSNLGSSDLPEDSPLKRLKVVKSELKRLEQILNDFLRFARLPPLQLETSDLSSVLEEVIDFIEPEAQRRGIEVHRKFDVPIPNVRLDRLQFKQALLNLILNASQSMPDGGQLTVAAGQSGRKVKVSISDSGCGIKDEIKDKLFDPFFSTKKEGTGLGLSITKQIIEGHGGEVKFTTEVGKGTTFDLFLPLTETPK